MDVFELTRQLISIPSISGDEKRVADFLADYLSAAGFEVELQDAARDAAERIRPPGQPQVVLSTHTDTVPPYVELREDDNFIYGRGACDAKGIIAAMVKAAETLDRIRRDGFRIALCRGRRGGKPRRRGREPYCQPLALPDKRRADRVETRARLERGSQSRFQGDGSRRTLGLPEMGESATDKLLDVLNDLRGAELPQSATLGATTMNIGVIKGGVAANVIPPEAEAELMFRVVTDADSLKQLIERVARGRAEISYTFSCDPVFTRRLDGFETTVVAFTTDIPLLANWGKPLLFGPGSILDAHTEHEKISKQELVRAVDAYARMVRDLKLEIRI